MNIQTKSEITEVTITLTRQQAQTLFSVANWHSEVVRVVKDNNHSFGQVRRNPHANAEKDLQDLFKALRPIFDP